MTEAEKETVYVHDKVKNTDTTSLEVDSTKVDDGFVEPTPVEMKGLLRKLDIRIVPLISFLYPYVFLGRFDVSDIMYTPNLQIDNLISLSMPFIAYPLFEIPSNLILKKMGPSKWFPLMVIIRAIAIFRLATMTSLAERLILRFILTSTEACLFSGLIFSIRVWYPKIKKAQEIRLFYLLLCSYGSAVFAQVFTYAMIQFDDLQCFRGSRWISIVATNSTLILVIFSYITLPDFPEKFKFLTERERNIICRLPIDASNTEGPSLAWKPLELAGPDFRMYLSSISYVLYVNLLCNMLYNMATGLTSTSVIVGITFIHLDGWHTASIAPFQGLATLLLGEIFHRIKKGNNC